MSRASQPGSDLPELGVGIVYSSSLDPMVEAARETIDVLEIEPQLFWFRQGATSYVTDSGAYDHFLRHPQPKMLHGVGFPVGGCVDGCSHIPALLDTIRVTGAPWVSEHLSFNRVRDGQREFNTGFLLPPVQSPAAVSAAASNIRRLKRQLDVPFAFETGVNYLKRQPYEMSDGAFFGAVAEEADCGILLDLHNLWCNEKNGRQSVLEVLDEMPLERVWEVHLAGGNEFSGYWLDAHSGLVPAPLMRLAAEVIPRLPNLKAIVFEIIGDYMTHHRLGETEIREQLRQIGELWTLRRTRSTVAKRRLHSRRAGTTPGPQPEEWESTLGGLVVGQDTGTDLAGTLSRDPGIGVYRHLVQSVRAGMLVEALRLTYRYLVLSLGEDTVKRILSDFWATVPPETFTSDEANSFAAYVAEQDLNLPHLDEVLGFEIATQRVIMEQVPVTIPFTCDPVNLLEALRGRRLPSDFKRGRFELTIEP